jgi:hypothetical protein
MPFDCVTMLPILLPLLSVRISSAIAIWQNKVKTTAPINILVIPYDPQALLDVVVPDEWSSRAAAQQFKDELISNILSDGSPFDSPMPTLAVGGNVFVFTGKFGFGSRDACQKAVTTRGGRTLNRDVSREVDFLVIGTKGSPAWKRGTYGNKIESALLSRREHGSPAIISEEHWVSILQEPSQ